MGHEVCAEKSNELDALPRLLAKENQCHHLLDVTYHEDHCQVRDKSAAHNLTLLRELSTKVLKTRPVKGSIRSKRKRCSLDPAFRTESPQHIFHGFGA